jgi:hypothetical protein
MVELVSDAVIVFALANTTLAGATAKHLCGSIFKAKHDVVNFCTVFGLKSNRYVPTLASSSRTP